jgi:flavin reductase (DIM6/NTAB) family NADH-FMN oxidoreductase RutF
LNKNANPVCILTTTSPADEDADRPPAAAVDDETNEEEAAPLAKAPGHRRNAMIISWLTPINNRGWFAFSLNSRRFSYSRVATEGATFVLCVPTSAMENTLFAIGKSSGKNVDKFKAIEGLEMVHPGGNNELMTSAKGIKTQKREQNSFNALMDDSSDEEGGEEKEESKADGSGEVAEDAEDETVAPVPFAIRGTVAHLVCKTMSVTDADEAHSLCTAQITEAFVHPSYWNGKNFLPVRQEATDKAGDEVDMPPPYLTFLGSMKFATVNGLH